MHIPSLIPDTLRYGSPTAPPTFAPEQFAQINYAATMQHHALASHSQRHPDGEITPEECLMLVLTNKNLHLSDTAGAWVLEAVSQLQRAGLLHHERKVLAQQAKKIARDWSANVMRIAKADGQMLLLEYYDRVDDHWDKLIRRVRDAHTAVIDKAGLPHPQALATLETARMLCEVAVRTLEWDIEGAAEQRAGIFARMHNYNIRPLWDTIEKLYKAVSRSLPEVHLDFRSDRKSHRASTNLFKAINDHEALAEIIGEISHEKTSQR